MEYAWRVFLFIPADNYSTFIHFMWIITIDLYRIKADKLNYHHINEVVCWEVCVQSSQTPRRWDLLGLWKVFSFHCLVTMFTLCTMCDAYRSFRLVLKPKLMTAQTESDKLGRIYKFKFLCLVISRIKVYANIWASTSSQKI